MAATKRPANGTPGKIMFRVRLKRQPEVTMAEWRRFINRALVDASHNFAQPVPWFEETDVEVFNHKKRPTVCWLITCDDPRIRVANFDETEAREQAATLERYYPRCGVKVLPLVTGHNPDRTNGEDHENQQTE